MAIPNFVIKSALEKAGNYVGGPFGAALGGLVGTTTATTIEISELGQKIANGNATFHDIIRATTALEASLLSVGILGGVLGVVAAPGALVAAVVVAAGVYSAYYKNQIASDDAIQVLIDGIVLGNQPWTIAAALADAYGTEIARQKAIDIAINDAFLAAKNWTAPRDPLVLDLDGDGIETAGIDPTAPVLFDMDGDGVKTATGWIRPDDGIVVLDRNGNGLIDSGRELFGDATVLARGARAGQLAANGFEALADLDLNADGRLDSLDASWGQLRIWRDLNQDGVSQAGELTTLAAQGIASLGAQGTQSNVNLGGGNTQVMSGSFTRTNGMLGTSGVAEVAGSLLLASNNFYRDFTDEVALTPAAQSLPQMQGSGLVRDLREAMSLGTAQAGALRAAVAVFAAGSEWNSVATKSIAGYASISSEKCQFDAIKRAGARHGLTRFTCLVDRRIGAALKAFAGDSQLNSKIELRSGR